MILETELKSEGPSNSYLEFYKKFNKFEIKLFKQNFSCCVLKIKLLYLYLYISEILYDNKISIY